MPSERLGPTRAGGGRRSVIVALLLGFVLAAAGPTVARGAPTASRPRATAVVMVRGYGGRVKCPGDDVTKAYWGDAVLKLYDAGWTGPLLPVSFYRCDVDGADITGYGPTVPAGADATITAGKPRAGYGENAGMRRIAHDLAWFVYDEFASKGEPVDLVGFSMGGLLIRYALYRVAAADPEFPPYLDVPHAVTISTPHAGLLTLSDTGCTSTTQCDQMLADSAFMTDLTAHAPGPQGAGGTAWTVIGSRRDCDVVPASSALAMPAALRVAYVDPCYPHTGYLWDFSDATDATIRVTDPGKRSAVTESGEPHVLAFLVRSLL